MHLFKLAHTLRRCLASRHVYWWIPALTFGLLSFGLDLGWVMDDHFHRAALTQPGTEWHRSPDKLFAFTEGQPERLQAERSQGLWPWWAAPDLRLAFWRPVAGWTHALDYRLWPDDPRLMHLQSIAWYLLAIILLLGLFRRLFPHPEVAGLAGLLFAIDDSQIFPALWLANRNAVLALVFGLATLLAHDAWRRQNWRWGAILGPTFLLLAVLSNEGAVAIGGYLLAYTLFLDHGSPRGRLLALLPTTLTGLAWTLAYKLGGFGASGSGVYIDPASEPIRFLTAVGERAPFLLWGWWGFPPSDAANLLPEDSYPLFLGLVVAVLGWLVLGLKPILKRESVARFLAAGMLLALIPACSTFPSNRLLGFVGVGASGLLAYWMRDLALSSFKITETGNPLGQRWLLVTLAIIHLFVPPLLARPLVTQIQHFENMARKTATSLADLTPRAPRGRASTIVVVTTPTSFLTLNATLIADGFDGRQRSPTLILGSSLYDTEIYRPDESTLDIRPLGGWLRRPGAPAPEGMRQLEGPPKMIQLPDHLFRDLEGQPFETGERISLLGVDLEILEVDNGRPLAIRCHFTESLESDRWSWIAWQDGRYQPFPLPQIHQTVRWSGWPKP